MQEAIVEVTTYNFSPLKAPGQTWTSKGEVIKFDGFGEAGLAVLSFPISEEIVELLLGGGFGFLCVCVVCVVACVVCVA